MSTITTSATFDPTRYLKKLKDGKDYLEVAHRLQWLRAEHPDASITTSLLHVDFEAGWAIFHARVEIPGQGIAEGTGSETRAAFPAGWLEKSETIAIGRALAALGYGTAFCLDFETVDDAGNGHLADAPAGSTPPADGAAASSGAVPRDALQVPKVAGTGLATPAQLKLVYLSGTRDAHLTEEEIEERCQEQYGRVPMQLTKREASVLIDSFKALPSARA